MHIATRDDVPRFARHLPLAFIVRAFGAGMSLALTPSALVVAGFDAFGAGMSLALTPLALVVAGFNAVGALFRLLCTAPQQ